ncbi:MAG: hypothetical protein ABSA44_05730 [Bacteroidota bacterium]|jgi:hypothetical protein
MPYYIIILYIAQVFVAYVCIIGILKYKRLINPLKVVVWYILFSLVVDIVKDVMIYNKIRTLWIDHWFSILELLLYMLVFNYWRTSKRYSILLWLSFVVYLLIWIVGKFTFEPFMYDDVYSASVSQTIQIAFGIPVLISIIDDKSSIWKNDPRFWIVSGIVFYAASAFFIFALFNVMLTLPRQIMRMILSFNILFAVIQYGFFLRAFLCKPVPTPQDVVTGAVGNFQNHKTG